MPRRNSILNLLQTEWLAGTSVNDIYRMVRARSNAPYWDVRYIEWICLTGQAGRWTNWNPTQAMEIRNNHSLPQAGSGPWRTNTRPHVEAGSLTSQLREAGFSVLEIPPTSAPSAPSAPATEPAEQPAEVSNTRLRMDKDFDLNRTFGIEIEFLRPSNISRETIIQKIREAGIAAHDESYNHSVKTWWKYITDSSVTTDSNKYIGQNEINSPIFKGKNGFEQIKKVCSALNELGCRINSTCGLHVHHHIDDRYTRVNSNSVTYETIANVFRIYKKFQNKIDSMLAPSRRGAYFANYIDNDTIQSLNNKEDMSIVQRDRRRVVNLQSFWKYGTLEFRQHSGSCDADKIINWVVLTQRVVTLASAMANNTIRPITGRATFFKMLNFTPRLKKYYAERVRKFSNAA